MTDVLTGGCLCQAVRYEITGDIHNACHCHCRSCRQTTGAATVTWATVAVQGFRVTQGKPVSFASTKWGERQFCDQCGSQLTFKHDDFEGYVDVTVNTLDKADIVPPQRHIWAKSQISWALIDEHLPKAREG